MSMSSHDVIMKRRRRREVSSNLPGEAPVLATGGGLPAGVGRTALAALLGREMTHCPQHSHNSVFLLIWP